MVVVPFSASPLPSLRRSAGALTSLSAMFAPIHALVALLMPAQAVQPHYRPAAACRMQRTSHQNANQTSHLPTTNTPLSSATRVRPAANRLKVTREFDPGMGRSQTGRMAISGSMADVCAELERIAGKDPSR